MSNFGLSSMALSTVCPTNKLITDDKGLPSAYVQFGQKKLNELLTTENETIHPAFMVSNDQKKTIFIGKFQGMAHGNRIYSLPGEDPKVNINLDAMEQYCRNKGAGHHCITAAEWALLALICKKSGHQPKGNNNYGKDTTETTYQAFQTSTDADNEKTGRVATGTGPMSWSHNNQIDGVWDLNGNVWEWVAGIRLVYGELQVIPYNNAADAAVPTGASSREWRAINTKATGYSDLYVEPNGSGTTANTVKLDMVSEHWEWTDTIKDKQDTSRNATFGTTTVASGVSEFAKLYLQAMALAPEDGGTEAYSGDYFYGNNGAAERCASRGGSWNNGASSGVFSVNFNYPRSNSNDGLGSRPAYTEIG